MRFDLTPGRYVGSPVPDRSSHRTDKRVRDSTRRVRRELRTSTQVTEQLTLALKAIRVGKSRERKSKDVRVGDVSFLVPGSQPHRDLLGHGRMYPLIRVSDFRGDRWIQETNQTVSERDAAIIGDLRLLARGTALITVVGTVGKTGLVAKPSFISPNVLGLVADEDIIDPMFLYYTCCAFAPQLERMSKGTSATPAVSSSAVSNLRIRVPDLQEQRRIAGILGAIDNVLEHGRRELIELRSTVLPELLEARLTPAPRFDPAPILERVLSER
jgi:type I restriction enzyme S subunit